MTSRPALTFNGRRGSIAAAAADYAAVDGGSRESTGCAQPARSRPVAFTWLASETPARVARSLARKKRVCSELMKLNET